MYRKILVPLDGSPFSERAIPHAVRLARHARAGVHLVVVTDPVPGKDGPDDGVAPEAADRPESLRRMGGYLEKVEETIRSSTPQVRVSHRALPAGNIVHALLREMREEGADFVAMSTHGRGALRRAWLGSVADGLIRRSSRPVLLSRPPEGEGEGREGGGALPAVAEASPFSHVLVPLDGSGVAAGALEHARILAGLEGARLSLLRVLPPPAAGAYPYMTLPVREGEAPEEVVREARKELEAVAAGLREDGIPVEVHLEKLDHPASGILRYVERTDVDLVAMSTRGRGGVARLLLGSVADKVIRGSPVPVLVHRPPEEARV